jgi:thiosulfate dehydrogenase (quinone) large subunit
MVKKKSTKSTKATYGSAWFMLAVTRISLGLIFVWAFLDKTFGLGFATPAAKAWVNGGSPTSGFLMGASQGSGPFAGFFGALSGSAVIDLLFMLALAGVGTALVLGIGLRVAAVAGGLLMLMMWAAVLPLENNPVLDDHIIYAMLLFVVAFGRRELSLASWWISQPYVKKHSWLW